MQRLKPLPAELQRQREQRSDYLYQEKIEPRTERAQRGPVPMPERAQKPLESVVKKVKEKRKQHLEESVEDMPAAHRMRILDLVNRGELLPDEAAKILRKQVD